MRSDCVLRHAAGADVNDFAGALGLQMLGLLREFKCLFQVQRGRSRLGSANRLFHLAEIRFEGSRRRGQRVGANQHHTVPAGKGAEIRSGGIASFVEQRALPASRLRQFSHDRRGVQNQHVVAARSADHAQSGSGDGEQQQKQADDFKQQAPRLLNAAAMLQLRAHSGAGPEAERGDNLLALGAVQQIQRDHASRDRAG